MSSNPAEVSEATKNDSYYCEIPNDPCAIVMFGASGDLAKRKLLPALYDLALHSCLAPRFRLLGFARTEMNDDAFRKAASEFSAINQPVRLRITSNKCCRQNCAHFSLAGSLRHVLPLRKQTRSKGRNLRGHFTALLEGSQLVASGALLAEPSQMR